MKEIIAINLNLNFYMKLNAYQKLIIGLYAVIFLTTTVFRVPFINNRKRVYYDFLFSSGAEIAVSRVLFQLAVIGIIAAGLFYLARHLKPISVKTRIKSAILRPFASFPFILLLTCLVIGLLMIAAVYFKQQDAEVDYSQVATSTVDTNTLITPAPVAISNTGPSEYDLRKSKACSEEGALENFKSHMSFQYPDWKIIGNPIVKRYSDCTYRIQFTCVNPHLAQLGSAKKEILIREISYNEDYSKFEFNYVRGVLY
jgi:hypothetical protein